MDDLLAHALVVSALILFFIQIGSVMWTFSIRQGMRGMEGEFLMSLLLVGAVATLIAQVLSLIRAVLLSASPVDSIHLRIVLFLIEEVVLVLSSVYILTKARRLL